MKKFTISSMFIFAVVTLFTSGCATYTTHFDYDPEVRFVELTNYDWLSSPAGSGEVNELVVKRIKAAVEMQLEEKGYIKDNSQPDFLIALRGGRETKVDVVDWGYTYRGPNHYNRGYSAQRDRIDVYKYEEGTLIIDFVDAATRELTWRGSVTGVIDPAATPEKRDKVVNEAVARVLANFPPPVK